VAVDILEQMYQRVPVPQTFKELQQTFTVPAFADDPRAPGRVILDQGWVTKNIVYEWFPGIGQQHVHKHMVLPLYDALAEIDQGPDAGYFIPRQCGVWVARRNFWKPDGRLSFHALGLAIDVNWDENPAGDRKGTIYQHPAIITTFKKYGFDFGGDWKKPDQMHFGYASSRILLPR
jgi:hypothetical protein